MAPWNIVARDGLPVALIDWETAGPVDPLVELAQLAWLNAKLHDDLVARLEHLPPLADRARQLAAIVDAYGLTARQRRGFLNQVIEFAICDTAWEADDAAIAPETTAHPVAPWAMAWRARSAAWMIRHRRTLETTLTRGASSKKRSQPGTAPVQIRFRQGPASSQTVRNRLTLFNFEGYRRSTRSSGYGGFIAVGLWRLSRDDHFGDQRP